MSDDSRSRITQILVGGAFDQAATDELVLLTYRELRQMADALLRREAPGHTLQPTALVHEAFMRLIGPQDVSWENRAHFFGAAARAMRRILIERARRYEADKRGAGARRVELVEMPETAGLDAAELVTLDEALQRLEQLDARLCEVVHLRFFAGLSIDETAQALRISPRSVDRLWTRARAWLYLQLQDRSKQDRNTDMT